MHSVSRDFKKHVIRTKDDVEDRRLTYLLVAMFFTVVGSMSFIILVLCLANYSRMLSDTFAVATGVSLTITLIMLAKLWILPTGIQD